MRHALRMLPRILISILTNYHSKIYDVHLSGILHYETRQPKQMKLEFPNVFSNTAHIAEGHLPVHRHTFSIASLAH